MKKRHIINLLIGIAVFVYLEYRLGTRASMEAIREADGGALLVAAGAFLVAHAIRIAKWKFFCVAAHSAMPIKELCRFYFDLKFLGLITPGRLGEFVPAFLSHSGERGKLISFTAYDRLTEALFTILLALVALTFVLKDFAGKKLIAGLSGVVVLLLVAVILSMRNEWMMTGARRVGRRLEPFHHVRPIAFLLRSRSEIAGGIRALQESLRELFLPGNALVIFLVTAAAVGADLIFWNGILRSISLHVPLGILVAVVTLFNMSGFISPTPAGIGVADGVFILFLRSLGYNGAFGSLILLLRLWQFLLTLLPWIIFRQIAPSHSAVRAPGEK